MTLLETLLFYRGLGMPIFPMHVYFDAKEGKNQKRPLVEWKKYQNELPSVAELTEWSAKYTAWGMATGALSHIIVVDVDTDKIEDAEAVLGVDLTSSMMVKTGTGGTHIYYKWAEELRNTVKIEDSPIDFRGDGGLVVLPPSHGDWGSYTWVKELSDMSKALLPELPPQIKALLTVQKTKVKLEVGRNSTVFSDGERNAASVIALRKLLGNMPQELWMSAGWYAFQHWCQTFCQPPLEEFQVKATFDWWVRVNAKSVGKVQARSSMEMALERIEERKYEATAPKTGYASLDLYIKGWVPGHLYVLTGETNAGKSASACNFAYRVFLQGKKVTYFALEPDVGVIEYFAGIHHHKNWNDITDEDLKMDLTGMNFFTKDANLNLESLLQTIEKLDRQDLIIVDHIGYFTSEDGSERSKTEQESNAVKRIVAVAKKKHSAILIIAHPRKPASVSKKEKPLTMNEISGSAAFKQDATDIMIIHMEKQQFDNEFGLINSNNGSILLPKVKTGTSGSFKIRFIKNSPIMLDESELVNEQVDAWTG